MGYFSDKELLQYFGLHKYEKTQFDEQPYQEIHFVNDEPSVIITTDGNWTLLVDSWYYNLWLMPSTRPTIERLAQQYDIFACSVGDIDYSFDFVYYQRGNLVRKYVVENPHFELQGQCEVVENFGNLLPGESEAFQDEKDNLLLVLTIANNLGLKTQFEKSDLRVYKLLE